ncbi:MAG: DUF883 family protein [Gammaproteobacteria bacterium]
MANKAASGHAGKIISERGKEQLIADFQAVMDDAEDLLGATADQGGEKVEAIRVKMAERLADAKHKLSAVQHVITEKTRVAAKATDEYVHENPWQSVMFAAGIGFIVGFITTRLTISSKS